MTPEAERFNGWAAMLGFVAAVGAYVTTGQIIPAFSNDRVRLSDLVNDYVISIYACHNGICSKFHLAR